ncbi:MAG: phosphate acyltransferase PlsX [Ignavibacteria bacterium]|jgi:glycerol-3-phosphate acyltransferase PlsX|nr:phosphate acyltransferase PlsX [Ignavibacteria bacterium]MCU7505121.1 phosphate acyltransferase PlsX [Ignavibacteria bacterium]MCU7517504.1 phosphate acyltransferase PlsX [Ignavibacteria bacterium]
MAQSDVNAHCRIVVDAMGGDFAPQNAVLGAIQAANEDPSIELYLIGKEKEILNVISGNNLSFDKSHIVNADEVITMSDHPTDAIKTKRNSSITLGARMVREKKAEAFVSAGNTGAMLVASTLMMGKLPGVERPTIGTVMPSENGIVTVFDVGASVDSKARHMLDYAIMGSIFVREIHNISNPKIGILSVGEEDTKGNEVSLNALELIRKTNLNVVGNIEGRDILNGKVNVVVCDGFVGNIILKFAESFMSLLKTKIKLFADKGLLNKLRVLLMKGTLKKVMKQFDYQTYGGVPLLGVNGISIIGHGSSSVLAIKNMVLRAKEMHDKKLTQKIEESLKEYANIS